jgi:hypothetical protein
MKKERKKFIVKLFNFKKMKQKNLFFKLLLVVLLIAPLGANAQVTIGLNEESVAGALLQLKNIAEITDSTANATLGLALPRVTLSKRNELYPMFLNDPDNPDSGPNDNYATHKAILDKSHTGLIVYNLTEDDDEELNMGLFQWDGEKWTGFQTKMGYAKFNPVNCSDINVHGAYIEGMTTTSEHYLSVNLNVTKTGAYTIMAITDNGYSFFLSGVALSLGEMTIMVPCQGTPINVQTDILIFSGIGLVAGCEPEVEVASAVAEYSLNCSSLIVNGQYVKGQALATTNTITLNITVSKAGSYNILTPLTYGIRFSSSGIFPSAGTFPVTLIGSGTPTTNSNFPITVQANTLEGNDVCRANIQMTLPRMTYAIIGGDVWSWNAAPRRTALSNGSSFGANGIVKILGLTLLWQTTSPTTAANNLNSPTMEKPDIVLYFAYGAGAQPNVAVTNALANYVRAGGTLIYGYASDTPVSQTNTLINGIFGAGTGVAATNPGATTSDDNVYPINNLPDDPIINGPFGNLSNRHWGEDNNQTGTAYLPELPPNSIQIATARATTNRTRDPGHSVVWYNDEYNFVYFGDCCGAAYNNTSPGDYPSPFSSAGLPQGKLYGPSTPTREWIVNSALELNAVAWAIKKAAVSGINPH